MPSSHGHRMPMRPRFLACDRSSGPMRLNGSAALAFCRRNTPADTVALRYAHKHTNIHFQTANGYSSDLELSTKCYSLKNLERNRQVDKNKVSIITFELSCFKNIFYKSRKQELVIMKQKSCVKYPKNKCHTFKKFRK